MSINRLLDEWDDPIQELYFKEVEILLKGIVFNASNFNNFKDLIRKLFIFDAISHRSIFELTVRYMNLNLIPEEVLQIKIYDIKNKVFWKEGFKDREEIIKYFEKVISKNNLNYDEVLIAANIENKSVKRINNCEPKWQINRCEQFANELISSIIQHMGKPIHDFPELLRNYYLNSILKEKNLIKLRQFFVQIEQCTDEDSSN